MLASPDVSPRRMETREAWRARAHALIKYHDLRLCDPTAHHGMSRQQGRSRLLIGSDQIRSSTVRVVLQLYNCRRELKKKYFNSFRILNCIT